MVSAPYSPAGHRADATSNRPVLDTQAGDFPEIRQVAGDESGIIRQSDRRDLQIHRADPKAHQPQGLKLLDGFLIEGQQGRRAVKWSIRSSCW